MQVIFVTVTVAYIVSIVVAIKGTVLTSEGREQVGIGVILSLLIIVIVIIVHIGVVFGGGVVEDRWVGDGVGVGWMHT